MLHRKIQGCKGGDVKRTTSKGHASKHSRIQETSKQDGKSFGKSKHSYSIGSWGFRMFWSFTVLGWDMMRFDDIWIIRRSQNSCAFFFLSCASPWPSGLPQLAAPTGWTHKSQDLPASLPARTTARTGHSGGGYQLAQLTRRGKRCLSLVFPLNQRPGPREVCPGQEEKGSGHWALGTEQMLRTLYHCFCGHDEFILQRAQMRNASILRHLFFCIRLMVLLVNSASLPISHGVFYSHFHSRVEVGNRSPNETSFVSGLDPRASLFVWLLLALLFSNSSSLL